MCVALRQKCVLSRLRSPNMHCINRWKCQLWSTCLFHFCDYYDKAQGKKDHTVKCIRCNCQVPTHTRIKHLSSGDCSFSVTAVGWTKQTGMPFLNLPIGLILSFTFKTQPRTAQKSLFFLLSGWTWAFTANGNKAKRKSVDPRAASLESLETVHLCGVCLNIRPSADTNWPKAKAKRQTVNTDLGRGPLRRAYKCES